VTWLKRLSQTRIEGHRPAAEAKPAGGAQAPAEQAALQGTLASEKVLKRLGTSVAGAGGDMQAIAAMVTGLKSHRAAQFGRAVDAFYNALGRSTQQLPDAERTPVVGASIRAMRGLVETVGTHPTLIPAMTALSSLLEPRGKRRDVPPAQHAEAAKKAVLELLQGLEGKAGASSLLFGFRNVVEGVESRRPDLAASQRPAIWRQAAEYLAAATPKAGCDQGELGRVVGTFQRALRATPDKPDVAFAAALAEVQAELRGPRTAMLQNLAGAAAGLAAGTPARAAADAMMGALRAVVEQNPAGPASLLDTVEALTQVSLQWAARADDDGGVAGYKALAQVVTLAAATPAAEGVLRYVQDHMDLLTRSEGARGVLARTQRLKQPDALAGILVKAHLAAVGQDPEQAALTDALNRLERLPAGPGLRAAVVLLGHLAHDPAPLAQALHLEARVVDDPAELRTFADRFEQARQRLQGRLGDASQAVLVATARWPGALDAATIDRIGNLVNTVQATLPGTPVERLLERGRGGEPGLLDLAAQGFLHDPVPMFTALLQHVAANMPGQPAPAEARIATQIAANLGRLDRNPNQGELQRAQADLAAAIADPGALVTARGAPRDAKKSLEAYLAAHPSLPVEVAFTAARTLPEAELSWVVGEMSNTRSHAYVRVLRDVVFATAQAGRADFITDLANSPADSKAKMATATYVASEQRQGNAAGIPWDELKRGLAEGKNPVVAMKAAKMAAALRGVDLGNVAQVDPAGAAILERSSQELSSLIAFLSGALYGKPAGHLLPPILAAVRAHADGTWPAPKYDSPAAREHLAPLRPEQLETWKRPMVTPMVQAAQEAADPASQEALLLLSGVAKTVTAKVPVDGPGFEGTTYDPASLQRLSARRDELLGGLRDAKKGSKAHQDASRAIGPLRERIALIELGQALERHFQGGMPADAQTVLTELKPLAEAAISPLRKRGQSGFVDALESAAAAVKPARTQARQGSYAADDDTLDAVLKAFGGGSCLRPVGGHNSGSLAEIIGGSQYKMIRAMRDDTPLGRGFLRLFRVELPNGYKGMALYMDRPMATPAGQPGAAEQKLMYQHGLAKAMAMRVPFLVADAGMAQQVAQERGLQAGAQQVSLWVHHGATGMHQSEGLNANDYFISWEGFQTGYAVVPAAQREAAKSYNLQVVMPPA
jgi:hypothetical protein